MLTTDEVWRLQGGRSSAAWRTKGGDDPECITFQDLASKGHYGPGDGSKQGIHVCTPSGEFLASINSNRPGQVVAMLQRGLEKWWALEPAARAKKPTQFRPSHRFEWGFPQGGMALRSTVRHLRSDGRPAGKPERDYNYDYPWFSKAEARQWLAGKLAVGTSHNLPKRLFDRLARLYLVDSVRGETRSTGTIRGPIRTRIRSIQGDVVTIEIQGHSQGTNTRSRRRGGLPAPLNIQAELFGRARFDNVQGRFLEFELVGKGLRQRMPSSRRRRGSPGSAADGLRGIGWFFTLATGAGARTSPTKIGQYGADWATADRRQQKR